jgi:hypothetical protein
MHEVRNARLPCGPTGRAVICSVALVVGAGALMLQLAVVSYLPTIMEITTTSDVRQALAALTQGVLVLGASAGISTGFGACGDAGSGTGSGAFGSLEYLQAGDAPPARSFLDEPRRLGLLNGVL